MARKKDKEKVDAIDDVEIDSEIDDSKLYLDDSIDEEASSAEGNENIKLKEGNQQGLLAIVRISENISIEQTHDANIKSLSFNGTLNIENPSSMDRLWDIELNLSNIENTNLESSQIKVRELGTQEDNNIDSREFLIAEEAKNLLIIKEYVNTLPNAYDILNFTDIENDLINLKDKIKHVEVEPEIEPEIEPEPEPVVETKPKHDIVSNVTGWLKQQVQYRKAAAESKEDIDEEPTSESEEEDLEAWEKLYNKSDEDTDGGTDIEEFNLESFGISRGNLNTITFAIAMRHFYEKAIIGIKVIKSIPPGFEDVSIKDCTDGEAKYEENQIIWTIDTLEPEKTALLKFTADIRVDTLHPVKTGSIEVNYKAGSSFSGGLEIESFEASTQNELNIDNIEQEEEPGKWECSLVFENPSEFTVELYSADVYAPENERKKLVIIDPDNLPRLPAGAQWYSESWEYQSQNFPSFNKKIEFRVVPELQADVNCSITIDDIQLVMASIIGEVAYEVAESPLPIEQEENVIHIQSYKETDIESNILLINNGSAPLNELSIEVNPFSDAFQPPNPEETVLLINDNEVNPELYEVIIEEHSPKILKVVLQDLRNTELGMLKPNSTLEVKYPVHAINPTKEAKFEPDVIFRANTYPLGQEIEFIPDPKQVPKIEVVHIIRKYRLGKRIFPIGKAGTYQIKILFENVGDIPLKNIELADKYLSNFNYSEYSMEPEVSEEEGREIITWIIDSVEPDEVVEISYKIQGEGEYSPKDTQLAF